MFARLSNLFVGIIGTKMLRRAKWSWFGYTLSAYVGLRLLRRYGIFTRQSDRLIRMMEKGADSIYRRRPGIFH